MRQTPLHDLHAELGARFTPFAGYEMPVQYAEGLRAEHLWTRENAGLFDVSHMGQVRVRGKALERALERALPVDFDDWAIGLQRYSLLLNDRGGIEDDLMLVRLEGEVRMVLNAGCKEKDIERLRALCPELEFDLLDEALIALQGPRAAEALGFDDLGFMHARSDAERFVTRSGYTGEDGFEIAVPAAQAQAYARRLLAHPAVKPVGLGARDTLRLEAGLHLYGADMDDKTTPHEAALGWAIAKSRRAPGAKAGGFPGADTVLRQEREGVARRLGAFVGLGRVPVRHGAPIADGQNEVGVVTSGTVSPSLGRPIMLGYVKEGLVGPLFAVVRGERQPIERVKLPFVPKRYKR